MKTLILTVGLLVGCHVSTLANVRNLEVPRISDGTQHLEPPPAMVAQPVERLVRVVANHVDQNVELASVHVRPVQGSACNVSSVAMCSASGHCQVGISVHGDVCVLLVRGVSRVGHQLESYCHDLSHPDVNVVPASTEGKGHPAWERCVDDSEEG